MCKDLPCPFEALCAILSSGCFTALRSSSQQPHERDSVIMPTWQVNKLRFWEVKWLVQVIQAVSSITRIWTALNHYAALAPGPWGMEERAQGRTEATMTSSLPTSLTVSTSIISIISISTSSRLSLPHHLRLYFLSPSLSASFRLYHLILSSVTSISHLSSVPSLIALSNSTTL